MTKRSKKRSKVAASVVAFAAMELLLVPSADAGTKCCRANSTTNCTCVSSSSCPSTFPRRIAGVNCPLPYATGNSGGSSGGTINSELFCTNIPSSGINNVDFIAGDGGEGGDFAVTQSFLQICELTKDNVTSDPVTCLLDLEYSGPVSFSDTPCTADGGEGTSTLDISASCGDPGLFAQGTLNCNLEGGTEAEGTLPQLCQMSRAESDNPPPATDPSCTLKLGLQGCSDSQFPPHTFIGDGEVFVGSLGTGEVLQTSVTTDNETCSGQVVSHGPILTRHCSSDHFDAAANGTGGSDQVDCEFGGVPTTLAAFTVVSGQLDVKINPQTINTKCGTNTKSQVAFTISASDSMDLTLIEQDTLRLEVVGDPALSLPATSCVMHGRNSKLVCRVDLCPELGQALAGADRDEKGKATIRITGELESGTEIAGEDKVGTSPKN